LLAVALLGITGVAEAQHPRRPGEFGSARFRLGLFQPSADSSYFADKEVDFTGSGEDLRDLSFGFDYLWRMAPSYGLMFTSGFFTGRTNQAYREWVDAGGREIVHTTRLETFDIAGAFVYQPGGRLKTVAPYFGAGGGFTGWRLSEDGDFIDFGDPDLPVVYAIYTDDGTTLMGFVLAGLEISPRPFWSLLIEARWRWASDTLGGAFAGFGDLDLSGYEVSAGFAWNF
jgi:hypothetical protein